MRRSGFVELAGEQLFQLGQHRRSIDAAGQKLDLRAIARGKHHEAHNAFSVHLLFIFFHEDVGFEFVGDANDHRGGSGMDTHLVLYNQLFDEGLYGRCGVAFVHGFQEKTGLNPACLCGLQPKNPAALCKRMSQTAIIVPCRLESTRFPRKLLHKIRERPLLLWVADRIASEAPEFPVFFAVDHELIRDCVTSAGYQAIMTDPAHQSGTDRLAEANRTIRANHVINVQADEPLVTGRQIRALAGMLAAGAAMATLVTPFTRIVDFYNPNQVKVVMRGDGRALYFSRSRLPFSRDLGLTIDDAWVKTNPCFKHLGLYAYRSDLLEKFAKLSAGRYEQIERLEQLRFLENGYDISCAVTEEPTIGIDTAKDVEKFEALLG